MIYFNMDKTSKIPLYKQIVKQVESKILTHEVKHLDQLPLEAQFESIYHISRIVVKKAYKILDELGHVFRIKGKGTFVHLRDTYTINAFDLDEVVMPSNHLYHIKF